MPAPDTAHPHPPDDPRFDGVSHGYAPDSRPDAPASVPLGTVVRDVFDNVTATAKAEMALLEARGSLATHGIKWASLWGAIAACALLVALLAIAFGAILALAPHVGPLLATLIVVTALLLFAAFAGWRAARSAEDIRVAFRTDLVNEGEPD